MRSGPSSGSAANPWRRRRAPGRRKLTANAIDASTPLQDLQGLLGLDESVSPGYEQIRMKMDIQADCSDEELDDLLEFVRGHSPVCTTVCRPVPVTIERVTAERAV